MSHDLSLEHLELALRAHSGVSHLSESGSSPAAVTMLFREVAGQSCVVMIKRASHLKKHAGEWAFPGGIIEEFDKSPLDAALRETHEELGMRPENFDFWCGLQPVDTSTGFEVWPFAGRIGNDVRFVPDAAEVEEVVNVPVKIFANESTRRSITVISNEDERKINAYAHEDRIIWGASARIITNTMNVVMDAS